MSNLFSYRIEIMFIYAWMQSSSSLIRTSSSFRMLYRKILDMQEVICAISLLPYSNPMLLMQFSVLYRKWGLIWL
ncbi:hypothetical protein D3C81_2197120 [compost metagenome]